MTDEELAALEALAMAATPGPWVSDNPNAEYIAALDANGAYEYVADADPSDFSSVHRPRAQIVTNAAYIAAANPAAILGLIADVRMLRRRDDQGHASEVSE